MQIRRKGVALSRFENQEGFEAIIRERVQMIFHWLLSGRQLLGAFTILAVRGRHRLFKETKKLRSRPVCTHAPDVAFLVGCPLLCRLNDHMKSTAPCL
jgi:hypothetical protein